MSEIKNILNNTKKNIEKNVEKASETIKLKTEIKANNQEMERLTKSMGEQYYALYSANPSPELKSLVLQITQCNEEENQLIQQKNVLTGIQICPNCGESNNRDSIYCINCGMQLQPKEQAEEA